MVGLSVEEAKGILKESGFEVEINENEIESINVKNQIPTAGIKAYKGSYVYLNN